MVSQARRLTSLLTILAMVAVSCGSDGASTTSEAPTTTQAPGSTGETSAPPDDGGLYSVNDDCATSEILNSVSDLDADAREAELLALAQEEGPLTFYSSMGEDDHAAVAQAFTDKYGIEVVVVNGSPETQHQRFLQETNAGRHEADIYEQSGPFLLIAEREGLLAEYNSPHREELAESANTSPYWVGDRFNVFSVGWNTDLVDREELPDDITGLANEEWEGRLGHDQGSWEWFAALWVWLEGKGWTEEQIDEFWTSLVGNGILVDGNPLLTELTELGEVEVGTNHLEHIIARHLRADPSLPIAWEPPVAPVVVRPNGPGIPCAAPNPATAILFVDWDISLEGQETVIVGTIHRPPTNVNAEGGDIDFDAYEVINVDLNAVVDDSEFWTNLWNEYMTATR